MAVNAIMDHCNHFLSATMYHSSKNNFLTIQNAVCQKLILLLKKVVEGPY